MRILKEFGIYNGARADDKSIGIGNGIACEFRTSHITHLGVWLNYTSNIGYGTINDDLHKG
jgi:hypothetical protein